jgi:hypothetical protein
MWSKFKWLKCNVGLHVDPCCTVRHEIAFLKIIQHCGGESGMQNVSTVMLPLLAECLQLHATKSFVILYA